MKPAPQPPRPTSPQPPRYQSQELFLNGRVVIILHDRREYQLRLTSTNKLILTA